MVVFSKVAAAFGLAAVASAMPTISPRQGFTIDQLLKEVPKRTINLPAIYANGLRKYGGNVPPHISDAITQGSAVTTPEEYDIEYLTPVNVGGTTLNLDFDTGSADLWVFSDQLPASQTAGHSLYKPSDNATRMPGYSWQISYGDGSSAGGDVYRDTVTVGGVAARGQAVEAASQISAQFTQDQNNDGLLGLAFSSINTVKPSAQATFFDSVKSQLESPLFAVTLRHQAPGSFDFGYIDEFRYTGDITYTDVDSSQGFWMFSATAGETDFDAIADTGTSLIMIDQSIAEDYYSQVPFAFDNPFYGGWTFPCSTRLPSFTITIDGYDAVVPGQYIKYAPVTDGSSTCFGGIQNNQGLPFSILGDVFLKSQYVVFDSEGPQIGFAPQA
ncbi:pepsin-like aspartic protease [Aspergillus mulundensis]|uniref:Aspergillopepsin-1 n=1 Tax=Aspergillus mulundensis TaxID=1810919 RepID=A0A3D8QNW1_9EURO|nr:Aspergillopepsin-1 [Aspergillus mulundensis]RDW63144.1 Aspergillopepsin-1 [Aspergillus mulundensis]